MEYKRYSVYEAKSELPIIVYGTSTECAKAMGITRKSFFRYICRMKSGIRLRKWLVYEDEREDEDG